MKTILSAAIGAMLALSMTDACAQTKAAERKVELAIEQQSLADALNDWAKQTGLQLVSPSSELMNTKLAPRLKGSYSPQRALEELLRGSSLTYEWVSDRAVAIREKSPVLPAALHSGAADQKQMAAPVARFSGEDLPLVAANDQGARGPGSATGRRGETESIGEVEEIVVTGTHIAGSPGAGSRVITLTRDYIEKSGHGTVEGLLKTLPQNFGGGVAQGQAPQLADENAGNFNQGTAVNLRGLGADSTLVLVDGRRQPGSGISGSFVDISSIPTSAIERIEILPDGASAIYGSDAVAGVVNFILRKDFDGAETQAQFGGADGGADQVQVSQLLGRSWANGNALIGYQYDDRGNLQRSKRAFSASNDLTTLGGSDYRLAYSNPGNILDPVTLEPAFGIPTGQDGRSLQVSDLLPGVVNYNSSSSAADLLGEQEMHSAFLNATQRFGDGFELFASGRFATRTNSRLAPAQTAMLTVPSSNPFFVDPFGGSEAVLVAYNFSDDLGLTIGSGKVDTYVGAVGASIALPQDWQLSFSGTYGREKTVSTGSNFPDTFSGALDSALADPDPATAFNPFGDGSNTPSNTLAAIRTENVNTANALSRSGNAILTGPLFNLGGGSTMLALGVDFRDEQIRTGQSLTNSHMELGREVKAAFAEIALPLVTSGNIPAVKQLALSLAGRYEDYSDFGTTFNERIGVTWAPIGSVKMRASWSTAFKAPRLNQLLSNFPDAADFFVPLPAPDGLVDSLVRFGTNPDLKEETADVWSAGLEWTPVSVPFRGSLTFWRINYKDRIAPAGPTGNPLAVFFEADEWADAVNLSPTREQVDAICRSPSFGFAFNPVTVDQCLQMMPQAVVDLRLTNLSRVKVEGIDLDGRYRFDTNAGAVTVGLNGVYMPSYDRQVTRRSREVDASNTTGNVLRLRLRGEASWTRGGWDVSAFVNYANSYDDTFSVSGRPIAAWTTVDGTVSYRFDDSSSLLGGLTLALHALNIFDRDPPFANVGISDYAYGYDTANADPFGRVLSVQVSKDW